MTVGQSDDLVRDFLRTDDTDDFTNGISTPGTVSLATILPGGIYTIRDAGRLGVDRRSLPAAYDSDHVLLPVLIINKRDSVQDTRVNANVGRGWSSSRAVLELYFEVDGDKPYDDLFSARDRVRVLLHGKRGISGVVKATHLNDIDGAGRAIELGRASMIRADYSIQETRQR